MILSSDDRIGETMYDDTPVLTTTSLFEMSCCANPLFPESLDHVLLQRA